MSGVERCFLGRSGIGATRIGIGLAAIARPGYITLGRAQDLPERSPEALYQRVAAVLDTARAAGVGYVDVARSYGRAEEFLARWLAERGVARHELSVGTKWGYRYTADWQVDAAVHEEKELSPARFRQQLAESRSLLGDWLDLHQIHSATLSSGVLDDGALLEALVAARRRGDCRAVGLTLTGPESARTLERALAEYVCGEPVFDVVQATFNLLEPSLAPLLRTAHEAGLGVIAKEVFANGRLSEANRRAEDAELLRKLRERSAGVPLDQLAVAFARAHPFVDVVLSGAATPAQLESHLTAPALSLEPAAWADLAESPERYWAVRASLPWQ